MSSHVIGLGPFRLREPIGRGGMGEVWSAVHRGDDTPVAVKILTAGGARDPDFVSAFRAEVRAVAGLDHPHVVAVYDHGEIDRAAAEASDLHLVEGCPYLVMEHVAGGRLPRFEADGWEAVRGTLLTLLDALGHAHAHGVVHRDLKPGNILVDREGSLRLTDFGLAHAVDRDDLDPGERSALERFAAAGTPNYMAPEQLAGAWRHWGSWTDLYALGCLAWRLLTGRAPYHDRNRMKVVTGHLHGPVPSLPPLAVPEGVAAWVRRLLQKRPQDRFVRAADASWALQHLDRELVLPPPLPATWRPRPPVAPRQLHGAGLGLVHLRELPMVGRAREQARLWSLLGEVHREGTPRLALLRGSSGCGKSRLARWLAERADEAGAVHVVHGSHGPVGGPLDGLTALVARHLRASGLDPEALQAHLDGLWFAPTEDPEAVVRLLHPGRHPDGTPEDRYALVSRILGAMAHGRPLLVWLDDLQWGVDALAFGHWVLRTGALPALLLFTVRDEALSERPHAAAAATALVELPGVRELRLGPLPAPAHRDLVRRLLGVEASLAAQLEARTAGNPLFAVQLVADWIQRDMLELGPRGFRLRDADAAVLPDDLHQVWLSRLERALADPSDAELQKLEVAAALGLHVDTGEWERACAARGLPLSPGLVDALLQQGLLVRDRLRGDFSFVHGMLRESLERRARDADRWSSHHAACAAALGGVEAAGVALRLGRHLMRAGRPADALPHLQRGWGESTRSGTVPEQFAITDELEQAAAAAALPASDPLQGATGVSRATLHLLRGDLDLAEQIADRVEAASTRHGWREVWIKVQRFRARLVRMRGRPLDGIPVLEGALKALGPDGDAVQRAACLHAMGALLHQADRWEEALGALEEAGRVFRALEHPWGTGLTLRQRAVTLAAMGRWDEAAPLVDEALHIAGSHGLRTLAAATVFVRGKLRQQRGDPAGALRAFEASAAYFDEVGSSNAALAHSEVALALWGLDRPAEAEASARSALEVARRTGLPHLAARAGGLLFASLTRLGRSAEARSALRAAIVAHRARPVPDVQLARIMAQVALGDVGPEAVDLVRSMTRSLGLPPDDPLAVALAAAAPT